MFVTISIQTYNNACVLEQALQSLAGLRCPQGVDYEILVVDNNSSDDTAAVVERSRVLLGSRLRGVFEPKQGLSFARNRAIAEAGGEIIAFVDDDTLVDAEWLAGHVAAYREDERTVATGGRVLLQWPQGMVRPRWLSSDLEGLLSAVDLGQERQMMCYPRYPFGCNMSVRREVAERINGFSVRLGRKKASLISNEEKHFFFRISQLGGQVVYVPSALVHHVVPMSRLSHKFFLRRGYAQGVSNILFQTETNYFRNLFLWHLRQVVVGMKLLGCAGAATVGGCLTDGKSAGFTRLVRMAYSLGYTMGAVQGAGRSVWTRPVQPLEDVETTESFAPQDVER